MIFKLLKSPFKWRPVKYLPFIEYSRKWKQYGKGVEDSKLSLIFRWRKRNA